MQVTFDFLGHDDTLYSITANVFPGCAAPAKNFARFQEPDEPDEVDIISIVRWDGVEVDQDAFSEEELTEIENKAIEVYREQKKEWQG